MFFVTHPLYLINCIGIPEKAGAGNSKGLVDKGGDHLVMLMFFDVIGMSVV